MSDKQRTAILMLGNVRTWEHCKESFLRTFGHLQPDVFLVTYYRQYNYHPAVQGTDHLDTQLTIDDIARMFSGVNCLDADISHEFQVDVHPNFANYDSCIGPAYCLHRAVELMDRHSTGIGLEYDCVIKTRCDIIYNSFDPTLLNDRDIIIDGGNVYPSDHIWCTKPDVMRQMAQYMVDEISDQTDALSSSKPPHGLLESAIRNLGLNVEVQKPVYGLYRKNGWIQRY